MLVRNCLYHEKLHAFASDSKNVHEWAKIVLSERNGVALFPILVLESKRGVLGGSNLFNCNHKKLFLSRALFGLNLPEP